MMGRLGMMSALAVFGLASEGAVPQAGAAHSADAQALAQLAGTGAVRIGLVEAPNAGVFFVGRAADGQPRGVTADLGADLAKSLGVKPVFRVFPNSGEATDATNKGEVDVAFMPVDDMRRSLVTFGPAYYDLESTFLATGASGIRDVKDADRAGLKIIGIANTTTIRAATRTLTQTVPQPVTSVAEAIAMMKDGRADAFALSRDTLAPIQPDVPGSHITSGYFQRTSVSIAVPQNRPAALAYVTEWLTQAKRGGAVKAIFERRGLGDQKVAD